MDVSRQRQELSRRIGLLKELLAPAFERRPLIPGHVCVDRFRCGKPTCRCARGEHHTRVAFRGTRGKKKISRSVRPSEESALRRKTEAYRRVRTARAEFRRWSAQMLELLDQMEAARTEPIPERPAEDAGSQATIKKGGK